MTAKAVIESLVQVKGYTKEELPAESTMPCPGLDGQYFPIILFQGDTDMAKQSRRKSYSAELREKAVRLVTERGYTHAQVAQQFGCSEGSIKKWKEDAKRKLDPELAARIELEEDENKRLRKENAQLRMEVEILKKATAYFAKETL